MRVSVDDALVVLFLQRRVRAGIVHAYALDDEADGRLLILADARRAVEGDGVPDHLDADIVPLSLWSVLFDEVSCADGPVYLEALVTSSEGLLASRHINS